jgi:hypothetical protein
MKIKGFNIEIDESRIATDQMVYLVKLMKLAKEKGFEEGYKSGLKQRADVMKKKWKDEVQEERRKELMCNKRLAKR